MKYLLILFIILTSCTTSKRVFICGDHECINKEEAKLFFEQNLSIEVKIIKKKKENYFNLVKLNTESSNQNQNIKIVKHNENKKIKKLNKKEIVEKKREIKEIKKKLKKENKKTVKKSSSKDKVVPSISDKSKEILKKSKNTIVKKKINNEENICNILEKCDIEEISRYLIKKGKNKDYPNISLIN